MSEKQKPRIVQDHEIREDFWNSSGGGIVRDCERHGKTFFNDYDNSECYEEGELADLRAKARANPEKYIGCDRDVFTATILGREFVWQCDECREEAYNQQERLWGFRDQIARYLNSRLKEETERAAREFQELTINISGQDGWKSIDTAPINSVRIKVLMKDGTVHPDAHFAQDLSGEDQPQFIGWFIPQSDAKGFVAISEPLAWKPIGN